MSDYPPPQYGYGGPNQTNAPYLPPTYSFQYSQQDNSHTGQASYGQNYDPNMSAYGYNGSVPGFSAAALASGAPPLPIYQGWNQDPIPLPAYTAPQNNMQHPGYAVNPYHPNNYSYQQQYPAPPTVQQHSYPQHTQQAKPFDEGEVSEGEYDDGYNPANPTPVEHKSNQYYGNDSTRYVDTTPHPVFAGGQDPDLVQSARIDNDHSQRISSQAGRPLSDSYSPYGASPGDRGHNEHSTPNQNQYAYAPPHTADQRDSGPLQAHNKSSLSQNGTISIPQSSLTNGKALEEKQDSPTEHPPTQLQSTQLVNPTPYKTVVEARKKAQAAILNLLPHEVRFQTYIEEGFDETFIGRLFDDLGMPRTSSKSINGATTSQGAFENQTLPASISRVSPPKEVPVPKSSINGYTATPPKIDTRSEGKPSATSVPERINKPSANGADQSSTTTVSIIPNKSTAASEKERTLQLKMEALRKSREQRAQKKNVAKDNTKLAIPPAQVTDPEAPKPELAMEKANPPSTSPLPALSTAPANSQNPVPTQSSPPTVAPPQAPAIPGLFRTSTASSPAPLLPVNSTIYSPAQPNLRKRPVAADFDTPTFKRPFGHNRNDTPLVIDVSDEESDDGDVAMDLESQADQDSPVQPATKVPDHRSAAIQNIPPLSNFPPRKPFTPPPASSAATTPPTRKQILGRPEDLRAKEMEIEQMRRKIAEAEAAKRLKKTQQSGSGTRTPRSGDEGSANNNESIASKVEASVHMQQMIDVTEDKVSSDRKRLLEAQAAESEKAAELKRKEAESKRIRREKIATDLPRVDAEVLEKQHRLEQLRAQMAEIEAAVQKGLEAKQKMAEEMEKLGQEAEDQLQAQKDKLNDLTRADNEDNEASMPAAEPEIKAPSALVAMKSSTPPAPESSLDLLNNTAQGPRESPTVPHGTSIGNNTENATSNVDEPTQTSPDEAKENAIADQVLEAALQEQVRAEADTQGNKEGSDMDIEDSYAPDPNKLAPESTPGQFEDDTRSPSYSPVLERPALLIERESDDYEPPDAGSPVHSPPFSPAPPNPVTDEADNISAVVETQSTDDNEIGEESLPQTNGSVPPLIEDTRKESNQARFFTPYESPLKRFRAFRFSPEFDQEVPGGLRSLTYSHKIDPFTELCRWEMAGGACNDNTCEFQHFRDMRLPDDAIISALGSPEDFTGEQRKQFCDGLRQVLTDLRARKIREFDIIAKEVVAHRARFLGDKSKVLMLEGTTI